MALLPNWNWVDREPSVRMRQNLRTMEVSATWGSTGWGVAVGRGVAVAFISGGRVAPGAGVSSAFASTTSPMGAGVGVSGTGVGVSSTSAVISSSVPPAISSSSSIMPVFRMRSWSVVVSKRLSTRAEPCRMAFRPGIWSERYASRPSAKLPSHQEEAESLGRACNVLFSVSDTPPSWLPRARGSRPSRNRAMHHQYAITKGTFFFIGPPQNLK